MISQQKRGTPINISSSLVGTVVRESRTDKSVKVIVREQSKHLIFSEESKGDYDGAGVFNIKLDHLYNGDIVVVYPNGVVDTLFRVESKDNTIFMTNMCNQNCIMCSQPPSRKNDIEHFYRINNELIDLIPTETRYIGISGGEPTLCGNRLGVILNKIISRIPQINIFILTNAVRLSDHIFVKSLEIPYKTRILFSIPLYGDNHYTHDSIVRSSGSFYKTLKGIYNLYENGFRVELRIIPQKRNFSRIEKIAHFIYRNLTFVENVAFMGVENIGNAKKNIEEIWIPIYQQIDPLEKATSFLLDSGIDCALYNYQNCTISERLRRISQSTISDWKTEYLPTCKTCEIKSSCGGIFNSSISLVNEYINPVRTKKNDE